MNSIRHRTFSSILWNITELMLRRGVGVSVTLMLAWFITPEDFGLVAMTSVFFAFSNVLVDAGFKQALIRKINVSKVDLNTAFFNNLFMSLIVYGVLFSVAPYIAKFYDQSVLVDLIRVTACVVFFNALTIVQEVVLNRSLNFKLLLQVTLPSAIISSALAIVLAYLDYGVWALVAQMVSAAFLTMVFFWRLNIWRPTLSYSITSLKEQFHFGGYLLLDGMISIPVKYMYIIVIAKDFSTLVVGLYFFAAKIKDLIFNQLIQAIQNVTYPALSKLQEDNIRLKQGLRDAIVATAYLLYPILMFIAALAEPLFNAVLPDNWLGAVPILQLMCFTVFLRPLHSMNLNILMIKGRSDLVLYIGIYKKLVAIGIFIFTLQYGVIAILYGQIVSSVLAYIPNSYFSVKLINYSVNEQIADIMPSLLLSFIIATFVYGLQLWLTWLAVIELVVFGLLGAGLYLLGGHVLKLKGYQRVRELLITN